MDSVEGCALIMNPAINKRVIDQKWNGFRVRDRIFNISFLRPISFEIATLLAAKIELWNTPPPRLSQLLFLRS